ncbi:nephrocystin-1-like [Oscarella lobularis]|uniref:nephrocystin-1-like n=1 Tax=Oscarella lobularis TaxID=121494 RepID=UPI00331358D8
MSRKRSVIVVEQAQGDALSHAVGELNEQYDDLMKVGKGNDAFLARCVEVDEAINVQLERVYRLTQDDDPTPLADFSDRKRQEIKRLNKLHEIVQTFLKTSTQPSSTIEQETNEMMLPPNPIEKGEEESVLTGDDDETYFEDDDDEEEEEEEEEDSQGEDVENEKVFDEAECLADFVSEQEGDLCFQIGELLYIIDNSRDDGWWLAENERGEQGMIPSNYIRVIERKRQKHSSKRGAKTAEAVQPSSSRSNALWDKLKSSMVQPSLASVLRQMGAVPSGFRSSTLGPLIGEEGSDYSLSSWLTPKLSKSHLSFRDLHWDHATNKLRSSPVAVTRAFSLLAANYIPSLTPASGLTVLSRHVRIALFNRNKVLSNVHTVRAVCLSKDIQTWKFSPKVQQGYPSTAYDADCVARIDTMSTDIMILFELCFTYEKKDTGERGEMSCGWASLHLFESGGRPVVNRTVELPVHGGTPYESGIELNPGGAGARIAAAAAAATATASVSATTGGGGGRGAGRSQSSSHNSSTKRRSNFFRGNRTPKLYVKLQHLKRNVLEVCNTLPHILIAPVSYLPFLSYSRYIMADELLRDRPNEQDARPICSPILSILLQSVNYPDIMDVLREKWKEEHKALKRSQKRNVEDIKRLFRRILIECIYPIVQYSDLPDVVWGDEEREQERLETIESVKTFTALDWFANSEICHKPFQMSELTYHLTSDDALTM